jgi:N-acyl-D-amino-acid deacylase
MCQGALGLSTGLFYAPQSFAKTDEVMALAREAGKRGGVYDSHIRDESSYTVGLAAAIDEAIRIGREGGLPAHIAHIKALGVDVQGQAPAIIAKVEAARRRGRTSLPTNIPGRRGTSLVASLMPLWAQDGGRPALLKRFDDPALAEKLRAGITENLRKRGGPDKLLIVEGQYANQTLAQVARRGTRMPSPPRSPRSASAIRAPSRSTRARRTSPRSCAMPWVMTGSDASGGHPRVYGTFARKYAKYVVADHVLTLRAVHRSQHRLPGRLVRAQGSRPSEGRRVRRRGRVRSEDLCLARHL